MLVCYFVMAGQKREARLRQCDPAIHVFLVQQRKQVVDARVKPGHDDLNA
jgi:hypothetical protein